MKSSPLETGRLFSTGLLLFLLVSGLAAVRGAGATPSGQPTPFGHPVPARAQPFGTDYDEQLGMTFTQNFVSIEYNVTAVKQTDPVLGTGPAYLVNGLSNAGYWYQVGFSYNWSPGENPGTGFDMNYEVFDNAGNSIYPTNGEGGVSSFSGPVHAGDLILLGLYFTNSTHSVMMVARDTISGAVASESYPGMGATYFAGLPSRVADSNGYFTGLMTEWYHGAPYFSNEETVVYSNPHSALSSAWLWMDEFDASTLRAVFSNSTSAPVSFANPDRLADLSYNGITEYADAHEFITGAVSGPTSGQASVPLIFSFEVQGGSGYAPPLLTYISNGSSHSTPLTGTPTAYLADNGTSWSVFQGLGGSAPGQRWDTDQQTSGTAIGPRSILFVYVDQEDVTFGFSVVGNESGYAPPTIRYFAFGSLTSTMPGSAVWTDVGSTYQYSSPLPGSTASERWYANSQGSVGTSQRVSVTYYLQDLVTFDLSFMNTEIFPAVSLASTSVGEPYSATLVNGQNQEWLDSGSAYIFPQSFSIEKGQRLTFNGTSSGLVSANETIAVVFRHQFYISVVQNVGAGGSISPSSGWYDSGSPLMLAATASPGWSFQQWQGSGSDSVSGQDPDLNLAVGPGAPANETAIFYPGISVVSSGPSAVSYTDGSVAGTVAGNSRIVVYVPLDSELRLTASSIPFLTRFEGWAGADSSAGASASVSVTGPATVTASSGYDLLGTASLVLVVLVVSFVSVWLARRRADRRREAGQ